MNYSAIINISQSPLFKGISDNDIKEILKNSQTKKFNSGANLFFKNDAAQYLFILVSGLIKLSNTNYSGEEAIIDIIQTNSIINQVFEDKFNCNAQAIENCEVMLIPLKEFRQNLEIIPKLSFNLACESSAHNASLAKRIESFKLYDAEERIGNFLLKSAFLGNKKRQEFNLKIKKSLIASYLGIKSETLSRAFKKIKNSEKLLFTKNKIKLNHQASLCKFCDEKIFNNCVDKKEHFCKNK